MTTLCSAVCGGPLTVHGWQVDRFVGPGERSAVVERQFFGADRLHVAHQVVDSVDERLGRGEHPLEFPCHPRAVAPDDCLGVAVDIEQFEQSVVDGQHLP